MMMRLFIGAVPFVAALAAMLALLALFGDGPSPYTVQAGIDYIMHNDPRSSPSDTALYLSRLPIPIAYNVVYSLVENMLTRRLQAGDAAIANWVMNYTADRARTAPKS
jgi:hypothetical protein